MLALPFARPLVIWPRFASLLALAALVSAPGCRTGAFPHYPDDYREYAYVTSSGSNTLAVLDLVHVRQQALLPVGVHPVALAVNPVRNEVYVVSQGAAGGQGSVAIVNAETNRVEATIAVGRIAAAAAVDAAGDHLYVSNSGSNTISVIDLRSRRKTAVVGVGEKPGALAVAPDGETLVVANEQSGSVSLLALAPGASPVLRASFAGCPGAGSVAVLPDATKAFVACAGGHQVQAIGLRTPSAQRQKTHALLPAEPDRLLALLDVGLAPVRLMMKPDGGEIFVANRGTDTISEIATGTDEVGGAALIGAQPEFGVVSADNALLWVANGSADTVAVYSVDDGKLINTVHVGSGPGPMVFSADGHLLLAANRGSGDVSLLRTFSRNFHREPVYGTLFTLLPTGPGPTAIADKAFRVAR